MTRTLSVIFFISFIGMLVWASVQPEQVCKNPVTEESLMTILTITFFSSAIGMALINLTTDD